MENFHIHKLSFVEYSLHFLHIVYRRFLFSKLLSSPLKGFGSLIYLRVDLCRASGHELWPSDSSWILAPINFSGSHLLSIAKKNGDQFLWEIEVRTKLSA